MMDSPQIGDRIPSIEMPDDPNPMEPGVTGMVSGVIRHVEGLEKWFQIDVDWDNGRTLMLVSPPDRFEPANSN